MQNMFRQISFFLYLGIASKKRNPAEFSIIVLGFAFSALVIVVTMSLRQAINTAFTKENNAGVYMILRSGADLELASILTQNDMDTIRNLNAVRSSNPEILMAAESLVVVNSGVPESVTSKVPFAMSLRGIQASSVVVREKVSMISGRMFKPGLRELVVGESLAHSLVGLNIGDVFRWNNLDWNVVGIFTDSGSIYETEIWTDLSTLQDAFDRRNIFQTLYLRRGGEPLPEHIINSIESISQVGVKVISEEQYYKRQSDIHESLVGVIGVVLVSIMAIGAGICVINISRISLGERLPDLCILQTIGYGRFSLFFGLLCEHIIVGMVSGLFGGCLGYLLINNYQVDTLNLESMSHLSFSLIVTGGTVISGALFSGVIGLLGGVSIAWSVSRRPLSSSLKEI